MGFGIRNPSTTDKQSEFSTWNPESTTCNPESKSVLDSLIWDKKEELKPKGSVKSCDVYIWASCSQTLPYLYTRFGRKMRSNALKAFKSRDAFDTRSMRIRSDQ